MNRLDTPTRHTLLKPLERFLHIEAASGLVLLFATAVALLWANSAWHESYSQLWHTPLRLGIGALAFDQPLHFWINEGLMTVFFLVAGLEIRRELHEGTLAELRVAALPIGAAAGGVLVPALVYLGWNAGLPTDTGWAVPTATDIAFAIGALSLLGRRVPQGLRILLLAIAIIDDVVAILVIVFFYSDGLSLDGLPLAAAGIAVVFLFQKTGIRSALAYVAPGALLWTGMLVTGVHPALAGVVLGLLTPVVPYEDRKKLMNRATKALNELGGLVHTAAIDEISRPARKLKAAQREMLTPVVRVQLALHGWVAFGIMPLFAFANAGINVEEVALRELITSPLFLGIVGGLVIGKPAGILLATVLLTRLRLCQLPPGVTAPGMLVIGCLAGIGFTMSLFLCTLAFADASVLATAKLAVLAASLLAGVAGIGIGRLMLPVAPRQAPAGMGGGPAVPAAGGGPP